MKKYIYLILLFILVVGLIARVVFCIQFSKTLYYRYPILDAKIYDEVARNVSSGKLIQDKAFFMGPLYPYSLGGIYAIFGHTNLVPRIVQMLLGLGCCILLFFIGRSLFSPMVGLCASAIYAIYKPVLFYEQIILSETFMAFFIVLFFFLLIQICKKRNYGWWIVSGLVFGFVALLRGNVILFIPVLFIWFIINGYEKSKSPNTIFRNSIWKIILFCAGFLISVLPATIHNYLAEKDFVLITSNAGFNLFIGNNERASGFFYLPPQFNWEQDPNGTRTAERALGKSFLKSSEVSRFWGEKAYKFIRENPTTFIKLLAIKFYLFWGAFEIPQIYNIYETRAFIPILKFPLANYTVIAPLAFLGLIISLFKSDKKRILLVLFVITYILSLMPFFITARFRIPIIPVLCLFAGYTVVNIIEAFKGKRWKEGIIYVFAILILLLVFNNRKSYSGENDAKAQFHNILGLLYQTNGQPSNAIAEYEKAATFVQLPGAYANLANLYYERKEFDKAIFYYITATQFNPEDARLYFNLGQAYLYTHKLDEARVSFEKAISIDAKIQPIIYYNLALLYKGKGEREKAINAIKAYLNMRPDDKKATEFLSQLNSEMP